jgi:hypothetical protein
MSDFSDQAEIVDHGRLVNTLALLISTARFGAVVTHKPPPEAPLRTVTARPQSVKRSLPNRHPPVFEVHQLEVSTRQVPEPKI